MSGPLSPDAAGGCGDDCVSILLVDDQPARLMTYEAILSRLGHRLVHARSGTEALQRLIESDFAAILLDINMPGIDGFETATLIHQHPRFEKTPIIFVTGVHVTDLDRLKGYELGAVDYVYVPVVPEILRGKVQVLAELYRQRRELERLNARLASANTELAQVNAALLAEKARELESLNRTLARANSELEAANLALQAEISVRVRAQEALEQADRRKDDFIAMLSHELRNPLAAMQGAIILMQRKQVPDSQVAWALEVLARQSRHLVRLIDDLLDVTRITRGRVNLQMEVLDLRSVVQLSLETVRPLVDSRRHELTVRVPDAPLQVRGDLTRLSQVLSNLISNAAKYTDEGGRIDILAGEDTECGQSMLRVSDNGRGIAREILPRLFEPSTHAEKLNRGDHGGLGIGLLVVKGLVEMHDGTVHAASDGPGQGSTFTVRLPLVAAAGMLPAAATAPAETKRANAPLQILVVDDNSDSAESLAAILRLQGHQVATALSGLAALEGAVRQRPDVVLLDIGMPGITGIEVAKRLRAQTALSNTVLVAVTGYGRPVDVQQTKEAGFDHHLVKPINYDQLDSLLARVGGPAGARRAALPVERH